MFTAGWKRIPERTSESNQGGTRLLLLLFITMAADNPGFLKTRDYLTISLSRARAAFLVIANVRKRNEAKETKPCARYIRHMIYCVRRMLELMSIIPRYPSQR